MRYPFTFLSQMKLLFTLEHSRLQSDDGKKYTKGIWSEKKTPTIDGTRLLVSWLKFTLNNSKAHKRIHHPFVHFDDNES